MGKTLKSGKAINRLIRAQRSEEVLGGLPLQSVRVLDMAIVVAAPCAATLMSGFGSERSNLF